MRIVGFGTYDGRRHPRVAILLDGFRASGDVVVEANVPLGFTTAERVAMLREPTKAVRLVLRLLRCWWSIARRGRRLRAGGPIDAVVVGYLGHFDVLLARLLFPRDRIVLDLLIFAGDTAEDRSVGGRAVRAALRMLDRAAVACADVVVLDTEEHLALLPDARRHKAVVAAVGAPGAWFDAPPGRTDPAGPLRVVFFGLYTPLQGAPTVAAALGLLADRGDIEITMIGTGQDHAEAQRLAAANAHVTWIDWVDPADLAGIVAAHHVCLGIFGTTAKAQRVVPNKVYQGAAAGCVVVTSDTAPQRRALGSAGCFVPPGDARALAGALADLAADRAAVRTLGDAARRVAEGSFEPLAVVSPLRRRLLRTGAGAGSRRARSMTPPLPPLSPLASLRWSLVSGILDGVPAGSRVLEVGCGQGRLGARIAARLPYLGLEPDAESCRSADAHIRPLGGEVRCASVDQLDPDERFGVLCAFEVLEHLEDDHGQLARWVRHLGPGGTAIVSVPAWPDRFGRWDEAVGHLRRYEPDTLRALLEGAGLEAVTTSVYGWPLGDLLERGRNLMAGRARTGASTSSRTAASGRQLQPGRLSGPLIRAGVVPFTGLQRLRPTAGPALLGWGRMP